MKQCDSLMNPFPIPTSIFAYWSKNINNLLAIPYYFDVAIKSLIQIFEASDSNSWARSIFKSFLYPFKLIFSKLIRIIIPSGSSLHRRIWEGERNCVTYLHTTAERREKNVTSSRLGESRSWTLSAEVWPVEEVAGKHRGHGKRSDPWDVLRFHGRETDVRRVQALFLAICVKRSRSRFVERFQVPMFPIYTVFNN